MINYPYKYVGLGGSFDHLHQGHKSLLQTAFLMGEKVGIAITTESLHNNKEFESQIQTFHERERNLLDYLLNELYIEKSRIIIISLIDPFGPAITDPTLQAHVSSMETYEMALKINEKRIEKGLNPLTLIIIPLVLDDFGKKLSSTDIRRKLN